MVGTVNSTLLWYVVTGVRSKLSYNNFRLSRILGRESLPRGEHIMSDIKYQPLSSQGAEEPNSNFVNIKMFDIFRSACHALYDLFVCGYAKLNMIPAGLTVT